jgi:CyaY protein
VLPREFDQRMPLEQQVTALAGQMRRAGQRGRAVACGTHREAPVAGPLAAPTAGPEAAAAAGAVAAPGSINGPFWPQAASMPKTMATADTAAADTLPPRYPLRFMRGILVSTPAPTHGTHPASRVLLSDADYLRETSALLARIEATCDRWLDEDVIDIDTHRTGGLLELVFPDRSKIVVNTQPPLQEMWLAARSGGYHYQWDGQGWRDTRDGHELLQMLSRQASAQGGRDLGF